MEDSKIKDETQIKEKESNKTNEISKEKTKTKKDKRVKSLEKKSNIEENNQNKTTNDEKISEQKTENEKKINSKNEIESSKQDLKEITKNNTEKTPEISKQNKQIMWIIGLMIIALIILIVYPIFSKQINKFNYMGLDFVKTTKEGIDFYTTEIPITNPQGKIINSYKITFREDPRKLEDVKTDSINETIKFVRLKDEYKKAYISLDPEMDKCNKNAAALATMSVFLSNFGGVPIKSATIDKNQSSTRIPYVTCKTNPNNTVMIISSGKNLEIKQIGDNCYNLIYHDCEITKVTEKFMMEILKHYMSFFDKNKKGS